MILGEGMVTRGREEVLYVLRDVQAKNCSIQGTGSTERDGVDDVSES